MPTPMDRKQMMKLCHNRTGRCIQAYPWVSPLFTIHRMTLQKSLPHLSNKKQAILLAHEYSPPAPYSMAQMRLATHRT